MSDAQRNQNGATDLTVDGILEDLATLRGTPSEFQRAFEAFFAPQ